MKKDLRNITLTSLINLSDEAPKEEETIISEEVEEVQEAPKKKTTKKQEQEKDTKYLFSMNPAEYDRLRAYSTITKGNINEIIRQAILEFLDKEENAEIMKSAEALLKAIRKYQK